MKICSYLELESLLRIGGIGAAINNQRKAMDLNNVSHTDNLHDDFDIIHINILGMKSVHIAKKMKKQGKKVILHAHVTADDFRDSYRFSNIIAPFLQKYLTYYYNQADLVLCPSQYTKGVLEGYGVKRDIRVISNGVDTEKFKFSEKKRNELRREFSIEGLVPFMVGHRFIRKGVKDFVTTARKIDNRFIWVGMKYEKLEDRRVKKLVEGAPSNVEFIEYVKDIVSIYCGGDIFFFPSHCENQGIVLLEASACGKPILVRDISTYDGWMIDDYNCLKAKNEQEFEIQLKRLIDDEWLRQRLAKNALKLAQEHSLKNIGVELKGIYEELLRK